MGTDNQDVGSSCTIGADGGSTCNAGEDCIPIASTLSGVVSDLDGGSGVCAADCTIAPCPGDANQCFGPYFFPDGGSANLCLAGCGVNIAGGPALSCPAGLFCSLSTPGSQDPGACQAATCSNAADCNSGGAGTGFTCSLGECRCQSSADCVKAGSGNTCDLTSGVCFVACSGPEDTVCQTQGAGCCASTPLGDGGSESYCDSLGGSGTTAGGAGLPLCSPCVAGGQCASGYCDSTGACNVSDVCGFDPGECSDAGLSCVEGDPNGGNCACSSTSGSAPTCGSQPFNPFDNGDMGVGCTPLADGGASGCGANELCLGTVPDGGAPFVCTEICAAGLGLDCPGSASCLVADTEEGLGICAASCLMSDGGGCPSGTECQPQTPNPADPGVCWPPCSAGACTSAAGTGGTCVAGICLCQTDVDCNLGVDGGSYGARCDSASGSCYLPCSVQKMCAIANQGIGAGCCETAGPLSYCNPSGGSPSAAASLCSVCDPGNAGLDCSSGFCDSTGHCNIGDGCTSDAECAFGASGATCDASLGICSCPGVDGG